MERAHLGLMPLPGSAEALQKLCGGSGFRTSVRLLTVLNAYSFPSLPAPLPSGQLCGQRAPFLPVLLVFFFSSSKMDVFVFVVMTYI